ncbi:MAG: hypothetical protein GY910_26470, partial [bacterium]|nr:hypothetical protein [bacterium]
SMDVIVPDDQLSLAIGRRGQNVRLAVQLTGWKIDIKSESAMREIARWLSEAVSVVENCGDPEAEILLQQGVTSLEDLSECPNELLTSLPGIDEGGADSIRAKSVELAERKRIEDEEKARLEAERLEREAAEEAEAATVAASAEATSGDTPDAEPVQSSEEPAPEA